MRAKLASLLMLLPSLLACAATTQQRLPCKVALVPSGEIAEARPMRYRAAFTVAERVIRFEVVSSREADKWIVVGLTSFGARLFGLEQDGIAVEVSGDDLARRFGLDPLHVLDALHRARLITPPSEEARSWERGGERVTDAWRGGRLVSRSFAVDDETTSRSSAAAIRIEYIDPRPAGVAASWEIRNPYCGYEARIVLLSASPAATPAY